MDDKTLLERAAKAAGIAGEYTAGDIMSREGQRLKFWNALASDADAFRLAVKLGIAVDYRDDNTVNAGCYVGPERRMVLEFEPCESDPYAATRRAIVRAAAALAGGDEGEGKGS